MSTSPDVLDRVLAGRYRLGRVLGSGGMASVFLAHDARQGREVAVKVLHPALAASVERDRFAREIEIVARLTHPHVLPLFDSGEDAEAVYYVMPYVRGESLGDLLRRTGPLPAEDVRRLVAEVASALDYAHGRGVVHRDVKPGNVLLSEGHAVVADFGVAYAVSPDAIRLTAAGVAVGSPAYMSPEQALASADVGPRADVYALGCLAFELLTGAPPFEGDSVQAVIFQHIVEPPPPASRRRPGLPRAVDDVLSRAMAKAPEDRFAAASDLARALGAALAAAPAGQDAPAAADAAADAGWRPPHPLPRPASLLVGRERELARVAALLGEYSVVTVVGPGGVGKTQLALRVAHDLARFHASGSAFVPLAGVAGPAFVASAVAERLGFTFSGAREPSAQLADFLRRKHLLLVLDNFEHVADAAPLVAELAAAPSVRVLVTSRERLGLEGEGVLPLDGLTAGGEESWAHDKAVELFLRRAQQADAAFDPAVDDLRAIGRICQRLGGLPLGIEIAAALVRAMPVRAVAEALEGDPDTLASGRRDVPARHRSLRAVFDYSWDLLPAAEARALARLAVLRGAVDLRTAVQVMGAPTPTLVGLVDKSLVRHAGDGLYDVHPAFRRYAERRLRALPEDAHAAERARAEWVASLVAEARTRLHGDAPSDAASDVAAHADDARAAWRWVLAADERALAERMQPGLFEFYEAAGWYREGLEAARAGVERLPADSRAAVALRARVAHFHWRLSELRDARRVAGEAADAARRLGYLAELVEAQRVAAWTAGMMGHFDDGERAAEEAVAHADAAEMPVARVEALNALSGVLMMRARWTAAERAGREALALCTRVGDAAGRVRVLGNLAVIVAEVEGPAVARPLFEQFLDVSHRLGSRRMAGLAHHNLGRALMQMGDPAAAIPHLAESVAISRDFGPLDQSLPLGSLAEALDQLGETAAARARYQESLRSARGANAAQHVLDMLGAFGAHLVRSGEREPGLALLVGVARHPATPSDVRSRARATLEAVGERSDERLEETPVDALVEMALRTPPTKV